MVKKTRYFILAIGFVFFLIAAPVIVLYVKGVNFNFDSKSFIQTGILAVRSNPTDAAIFLDGQQKRQNQGDLTFLLPGSYTVNLKKTGYSDWTKRLAVEAGQVTWASPSFGNIYLFLQNPPVQNLAGGVLDFYSQDKNFVYLTKDSFITSVLSPPAGGPGTAQTYPLPKSVNKILAQDAAGKIFALTNSAPASSSPVLLIFNQNSGVFYDISGLFGALPKLQFGDDGGLYALSNSVLYSVNTANKTKTALFSGVKTFYFQGGALYLVQQKSQTWSLFVSQAPFSASQDLADSLPGSSSGELFVTYEKEIFLLADERLYSVSSGMQQLSDNISGFNFDPNDSSLSVIHSGELDYYDPLAGNLNFVTRSSEALTNPKIFSSIGNAFFFQGQKLVAIELDARDNQNQYQLYLGTDVKKFFVDSAGKNILLLDNDELKSLVIR